jgi:hypothetical protein
LLLACASQVWLGGGVPVESSDTQRPSAPQAPTPHPPRPEPRARPGLRALPPEQHEHRAGPLHARLRGAAGGVGCGDADLPRCGGSSAARHKPWGAGVGGVSGPGRRLPAPRACWHPSWRRACTTPPGPRHGAETPGEPPSRLRTQPPDSLARSHRAGRAVLHA